MNDVDAGTAEKEALLRVLRGHGFEQAIDVALIEESMFADILESRGDLAGTLRAAVDQSRLSIGGWARAVSRYNGGGCGVVSAGGLCLAKLPPRAAPVPGDPPATRSRGGRPG